MARRGNNAKHPALASRSGIETLAELDQLFMEPMLKMVPKSLEKLDKLLDHKSPQVVLGAIKHLHALVGLGGEVIGGGNTVKITNVNTWMTKSNENGRVVDAE